MLEDHKTDMVLPSQDSGSPTVSPDSSGLAGRHATSEPHCAGVGASPCSDECLNPTSHLHWQEWQKEASQGCQKLMRAKNVFVALWSSTILVANVSMSRWLIAMAMSHTLLVLALGWHAYIRLRRLQAPGARPIALEDRTLRSHMAPVGAWVRLGWAGLLAVIVLWTHVGGMVHHYDRKKCIKNIRCWRAWVLTLGFCIGSVSLALQYVYAEWLFLRTGVRISHFLHTRTAFMVDEHSELTTIGGKSKEE